MVIRGSLALSIVSIIMHITGVCALSPTSRRSFLSQANLTFGVGLLVGSSSVAEAYERRDVGSDASRSAATYAFNEQAFLTNNRLEAEGFRLDTREEEKAKLNAAMASFSYESTTSSKGRPSKTSNNPKNTIRSTTK